MRSTVVEAADQPTSSLGKKVEAEAAAKLSMRSTRVARSTSSPSANGARRPSSGHVRTPCASGTSGTAPRASAAAALLWQSSSALQQTVGDLHAARSVADVCAPAAEMSWWRTTSGESVRWQQLLPSAQHEQPPAVQGQGQFLSCVAHAMLKTILQQLLHKFNTKLLFTENISLVESKTEAHVSVHPEDFAERISSRMKGHEALKRSEDARLFEVQVNVERRNAFQELLRVVANSALYIGEHGCGTCVVVLKTSNAAHALHAVAAQSVADGKVRCLNSWGNIQEPIMECTTTNFRYFYIVHVQLTRLLKISETRTLQVRLGMDY